MPVDHDGKIRMDCSSPFAMANLVKLKDDFQVAFGNDPDSDRHGIVTPTAGLMKPQPLPGRGDRLPAGQPPRLAGGGGDRQDGRQQLDDRPRRGGAGPEADGGAGGVQVVRPGAVRRDGLLRRRGERGGQLSPHRRDRLVHRQGRTDFEPAGGRDHRQDRPRPRPALRRPDGQVRVARLHPHRRPGHAGPEKCVQEADARRRPPPPRWPASRSRPN